MNSLRPALRCLVFAIFLAGASRGSAKYPAKLDTAHDIERTAADYYAIDIGRLPLPDYPSLGKFGGSRQVNFLPAVGPATDAKLRALAAVPGMNVPTIFLRGSTTVTDAGGIALSTMKGLRNVNLSRTSISDETLMAFGAKPGLASIMIEGCDRVTLAGLRAVLGNPALRDVSFSMEHLTAAEVRALVQEFSSVNTWLIVDPALKLAGEKPAGWTRRAGVVVMLRRTWESPKYP